MSLMDSLNDHIIVVVIVVAVVSGGVVFSVVSWLNSERRRIMIEQHKLEKDELEKRIKDPNEQTKVTTRQGTSKTFVPTSALIKPFRDVNRFFLQVLIKRFQLTRQGKGVLLEVDFDGNTLAIWSSQGKQALMDSMPEEERNKAIEECQRDLEPIPETVLIPDR